MKFHTMNSIYEVDQDNKRIRRVEGDNPPTDNFEEDGKWHDYEEVFGAKVVGFRMPAVDGETKSETIEVDKNVVVKFKSKKRPTFTSPVQEIKEDE